MQQKKVKEVTIKMPDDILRGAYANIMRVTHNKEMFTMDFIHMSDPAAIVTARVLVNPPVMKQILQALANNLQNYEAKFGPIKEAPPPKDIPTA